MHRNTGQVACRKNTQEHKGTWDKYTAGLYDPPDVGSVSAGLLLLPGSCSTPARRIISKKRGILGELKHMASGTLHTSGTLGLGTLASGTRASLQNILPPVTALGFLKHCDAMPE